jgi:hypothetical protein
VTGRVLWKLMQRNDQGATIPNDLWNSKKSEEDIPHQILPEICLGVQSITLDQNKSSHLQYFLQVGWNVDSVSQWHSKGCANYGVDKNS